MKSSRPLVSYHPHVLRDNRFRQPAHDVKKRQKPTQSAKCHRASFHPCCNADMSGHQVIEGKKLWVAPIVCKQFLCDKRNPPLEPLQADALCSTGLSQLDVMQQGFLILVFPPPPTSILVITCSFPGHLNGLSLLSIQLVQHLVIISVSWLQACALRCRYHVLDTHATATRTGRAWLAWWRCFTVISNWQGTRRIVAMGGLWGDVACLSLVAITICVIAGRWVGLVAHRRSGRGSGRDIGRIRIVISIAAAVGT